MRHMFPGFCAMACKLLLMRTLLSTSLLDQRTHPVIEKFDFRANTLAQFTWSQVDVQAGALWAVLCREGTRVRPRAPSASRARATARAPPESGGSAQTQPPSPP